MYCMCHMQTAAVNCMQWSVDLMTAETDQQQQQINATSIQCSKLYAVECGPDDS